MNVLGRQLSERFDALHSEAVNVTTCQSIEFKPLSSLYNVAPHDIRGVRRVEGDIVAIYLDTELANKQFELTAAHELCHELVGSKGIGVLFRIEGIPANRLPQANQWAARFGDCLSHVAVNHCMKDHEYDITDYDAPSLDNLRKLTRSRAVVTRWDLSVLAMEYISHLCRWEYACPSIDVGMMTKIYKKWHPRIVKLSKRFMAQIADVNVTTPTVYYKATKALRDAIGKEFKVNVEWIKFRNPDTGEPE